MSADYEPTLEEQRETHYKQIETLVHLLDWVHDFLKEKNLETEYWNWKVAKGYVKPEGGLLCKSETGNNHKS